MSTAEAACYSTPEESGLRVETLPFDLIPQQSRLFLDYLKDPITLRKFYPSAVRYHHELAQRVPEVLLFDTEILPITDFIADYANIFAVKPLLLFDVAHLGPASVDTPTRYGAGGGIQLDIVMARFEFGYVAALNRAPGDPRGNFFGRLVLRRLF